MGFQQKWYPVAVNSSGEVVSCVWLGDRVDIALLVPWLLHLIDGCSLVNTAMLIVDALQIIRSRE